MLFPNCVGVLLVSSVLAQYMYKVPHCIENKDVIIHLFEWKWDDIASECETFLGPYGFCAVQTSPANENRIVTEPNRPWWERYQPVSYKLQTRSGDENSFKDMVQKCNKAGVRIYVDVEINHMTQAGVRGKGTGGSSYDAKTKEFPAVPYGPIDFNDGFSCNTSDLNIHNYSNPEEVRECRLSGLLDLHVGSANVVNKVTEYMNHLIDLGVTGFRVDSAMYIWPGHLMHLLGKLKKIKDGGQPFIYQEVTDLGEKSVMPREYLSTGRITNFIFGLKLAAFFRKKTPLRELELFGVGWGMWNSDNVVNYIDNHKNQRGNISGYNVLTNREPRPYKMATAFMLAYPYGMPRIMSSYEVKGNNYDEGPPHKIDMSIQSVIHKGMRCDGGWICEHRWREIYNMVAFRNSASGTPVANWWSGTDYQIAFSRGNKAFIAFNLDKSDINQTLQTGLPAGTYCDIISGELVTGKCTGKSVDVKADGKAVINVCNTHCDSYLAIHVGAKV